jgi:hypothetical protein
MQDIQRTMPNATVTLREHRLAWKGNAHVPALTIISVLVTLKRGPLVLRREYDPKSLD